MLAGGGQSWFSDQVCLTPQHFPGTELSAETVSAEFRSDEGRGEMEKETVTGDDTSLR